MIVYRDMECTVDARALLRRLSSAVGEQSTRATPSHPIAVRLLVEFGQLEAAWCDDLMPLADTVLPQTRLLRGVAFGLGHFLRTAWLGREPPANRALRDAIDSLSEANWVPSAPLRAKVPEGFAFYGLYPETYIQAAEQFAAGHQSASALCIGLRSIGTALSALIGATLEAHGWQVESYTLRPRGDPFARRPILAPDLAKIFKPHSDFVLLVDEGPGISGSSLAGTAALFSDLGYSDERIVLFPSWNPDPRQLNSPEARARWARHPIYVGNFDDVWVESGKLSDLPLNPIDAGRWRARFFTPERYPAVHPQHERRKFLTAEREHLLYRFAGLGPFGESVYERGLRLAEAGYTPPLLALRQGFVVQKFVPGRALEKGDCSIALLRSAARYLAFLQREFPSPHRTSPQAFRTMAETNIGELLGHNATEAPVIMHEDVFDDAPAVALDGRMQPWEWIATVNGYVKTDALDHHADHFFPGCTDIAWDLAGFSVEFELDGHGIETLIQLFTRYGGDRAIRARLPFFRVAYTAFRAGYAALATFTLTGTPEAVRFEQLTKRYRLQLQQALQDLRHGPLLP